MSDFGVRWFGIKGGEPLTRPDIFEIVTYAKNKGLNVCLLTNGVFVDGTIYDNLVKNQVWTSVSIDGPEEINDQLRGKGSYKKALAAIEKLSKGKILNGLACAITTINYQHLDHVAELADKYHANFVWYNHLGSQRKSQSNNGFDADSRTVRVDVKPHLGYNREVRGQIRNPRSLPTLRASRKTETPRKTLTSGTKKSFMANAPTSRSAAT